jgi:hypothetical protein
MLVASVAEQTQINKTIRVVSKNIRFSVAALKNMMRTTRDNNTCKSQVDASLMRGGARAMPIYFQAGLESMG